MMIDAHYEESLDWFGFSASSMFRYVAETVCIDWIGLFASEYNIPVSH